MQNQDVVQFVRERLVQGLELSLIIEALTDNCLAQDASAGIGCDNMTVVIVAILAGKTLEEWRQMFLKD